MDDVRCGELWIEEEGGIPTRPSETCTTYVEES